MGSAFCGIVAKNVCMVKEINSCEMCKIIYAYGSVMYLITLYRVLVICQNLL